MNYIIGGGIAGLAAALYLPDYTVLTFNKGGQMNNQFPLGPRILECTEYTSEFLGLLDIHDNPREFFNGYLYHGKIHNSLDTEMKKIYSLKTRGVESTGHVVGNSGRNKIVGWPITKQLISAMLNLLSGRVKEAHVSYINTKEKVIHADIEGEWQKVPYNKLISTIPITELFNIVHEQDDDQDTNPGEFEYRPTYFAFLPGLDLFMEDFVYILDEYTKFHRATRVEGGTVLESRNPIDLMDFPQYLKMTPQSMKLKLGQIVSDVNMVELSGIKLLGRFAQWAHSIRTAEVIKRIKEELI